MKPNIVKYKYTRYAMWVGAIAALVLRFVVGEAPLIAIGTFAIALGVGLFIDLVIRRS